MNENVFPIMFLLKKTFLIPAYQRGYRWGKEQVTDLLDDIKEFSEKRSSDSTDFYCLQPIVVKKSIDGKYEVLDGQQRLTTILLIIKNIIKRENNIEEYALGEPIDSTPYVINYQTRIDSEKFLGKNSEDMEKSANDYIDYFYINQAAKVISEWFKDKKTKPEKRSLFDIDFLKNTKIIWYEVDKKEDVIKTFTRLNMGKIKLTNAELVKSLFLNSSNFENCDKNTIRLRQFEIANEWDNIEYTLQNNELWGFIISNNKIEYTSRIEYILNLISKKSDNDKCENFTFNFFSNKFKKLKGKEKDEAINENWRSVKTCFQTINDWFENKEYYHKIGYLRTTGSDMNAIMNIWTTNRIGFSNL